MGKLGAWVLAAVVFVGCSGGSQVTPTDSGNGNTGIDAGTVDGGGNQAPLDAGTTIPIPPPVDGGTTVTPADGGTAGNPPADGGVTNTMAVGSLGVGPWPTNNVTYGAADGIQETPIVGITTDESQNLWVATNSALYLRTPAATRFIRFDASAGLHLQSNSTLYCADQFFAGGTDKTCRAGAASDPGIAEIVGGGPNEVFVGYWGFHNWADLSSQPDGVPTDGSWGDIYRHTGKIDRVRLTIVDPKQVDASSDKLDVVRFDVVSGNTPEFWHNRDSYRMVYDHFIHKHELYVGFEHGIDKFSPDLWFEPNKQWPFNDELAWMSDHLHPMTCMHQLCIDDESRMTEMMGDWRGLALDAKGDLWVGGKWSAGKIFYTPLNAQVNADGTRNGGGTTGWFQRAGKSYEDPVTHQSFTFGFQFCGTAGHELQWNGSAWVDGPCPAQSGTPPVFWPPQPGDPVSITAVAVTTDGKSWWSSGPVGGNIAYGLASYDGKHFAYFNPADVGMSENNITDMIGLPDGRLVIAGGRSGLTFWNPATGAHTSMHAGQGLPSDQVIRMELDMMVSPPALHVSTANGAATIRVFP
jgi:hypothetical protein